MMHDVDVFTAPGTDLLCTFIDGEPFVAVNGGLDQVALARADADGAVVRVGGPGDGRELVELRWLAANWALDERGRRKLMRLRRRLIDARPGPRLA